MKKGETIRGALFVGMLFVALLCFMAFNYLSTLETLKHILGAEFMVYAFAFALSVVDFAGLARIFTPETDTQKEGKLVYLLGAVWVLACLFDVVMTSYWVSYRMSMRENGSAVSALMGEGFYRAIPWIVAFGELTIRIPLVLMVGMYGDQLLHGLRGALPSVDTIRTSVNSISTPRRTLPSRPPTPTFVPSQLSERKPPTFRPVGVPNDSDH